jgi:hypothetical protein
MTEVVEKGYQVDIPRETIEEERIWNKRPHGVDIKMPTPETGVHKIDTRTSTWTPRMVGESEQIHSRSTISKRGRGRPRDNGIHDPMESVPRRTHTPPHHLSPDLSVCDGLIILGVQRRRRRKGLDSIKIDYDLNLEGGDQQVAP